MPLHKDYFNNAFHDRCLYDYDYTAFCDYCKCITPFKLNKCIICNMPYYKLRWKK